MSEKLIAVASFSHPFEAEVAKAKLEAIGIECVMEDDATLSVDRMPSQSMGGVKIKVRESDARRAAEMLGRKVRAEAKKDKKHAAGEASCPKCSSTEVHAQEASPRSSLVLWLFQGLGARKRRWKCSKCGHEWKE